MVGLVTHTISTSVRGSRLLDRVKLAHTYTDQSDEAIALQDGRFVRSMAIEGSILQQALSIFAITGLGNLVYTMVVSGFRPIFCRPWLCRDQRLSPRSSVDWLNPLAMR